jgi:hypothetical protein
LIAGAEQDGERGEGEDEDTGFVREQSGGGGGECGEECEGAVGLEVAESREEVQEEEEEAERVGAGADPGDGLGVDGEAEPEERGCCCGEGCDAQASEELEEKGCVEGVKEEAGEVEACRRESPKVAVERKGEPVEWAIGGAWGGGGAEGGGEVDRGGKEAGEDVVPLREIWVADDLVEVVVDEGRLQDAAVEEEGGCGDDEEPDPGG